jgi:hypothetical protein
MSWRINGGGIFDDLSFAWKNSAKAVIETLANSAYAAVVFSRIVESSGFKIVVLHLLADALSKSWFPADPFSFFRCPGHARLLDARLNRALQLHVEYGASRYMIITIII